MQAQSSSPLLTLPAELRTSIFQYVYPQDHQIDKIVDLAKPRPPSKALILSNKQIYNEAHHLYYTSYQRFWTSSLFNFTIRLHTAYDKLQARSALIRLGNVDTDHITNLTVDVEPSTRFTVVHPRGGWKLETEVDTTYRRYRVWISKGEVVPTLAAWDGHENERTLRDACTRCSCRVPLINQVLDLMDLELLDWPGCGPGSGYLQPVGS